MYRKVCPTSCFEATVLVAFLPTRFTAGSERCSTIKPPILPQAKLYHLPQSSTHHQSFLTTDPTTNPTSPPSSYLRALLNTAALPESLRTKILTENLTEILIPTSPPICFMSMLTSHHRHYYLPYYHHPILKTTAIDDPFIRLFVSPLKKEAWIYTDMGVGNGHKA